MLDFKEVGPDLKEHLKHLNPDAEKMVEAMTAEHMMAVSLFLLKLMHSPSDIHKCVGALATLGLSSIIDKLAKSQVESN